MFYQRHDTTLRPIRLPSRFRKHQCVLTLPTKENVCLYVLKNTCQRCGNPTNACLCWPQLLLAKRMGYSMGFAPLRTSVVRSAYVCLIWRVLFVSTLVDEKSYVFECVCLQPCVSHSNLLYLHPYLYRYEQIRCACKKCWELKLTAGVVFFPFHELACVHWRATA